jgi:hypothetical protein
VDTTKDIAQTTKDTATGTAQQTDNTITSSSSQSSSPSQQEGVYEEGRPGTELGRKDDPLTEYREKEAMTPAKIKEHEPTAVKREMTEKIVEPGQEGIDSQEANERARRSGMTKGTAGAGETGSEYEQGAAGSNQ